MRPRALAVASALAVAATAVPAHAQKLGPDFKAAFELVFRPKYTYAVVIREGVPTTSVYGVDGKSSSTAHYSVDVVDGRWRASEGILDFDQTAVDYLNPGELMEVASIAYKDNRVDLRMVSLEAHRVTRGGLLKSTKREPVATNFKFFFPFLARGEKDVPQAVDYIGTYLRPFRSEQEARAFAGSLAGGEARASTSAPRASSTGGATGSTSGATSTSKKEIKVGMTPLEVLDVLGKPQKEVTFENKSRWTYPDLTVLFENGRVKEVKF
jgi:hypothetical protein